MSKLIILLSSILLLFTSINAYSQTQIIAHKSHSGTMEHFVSSEEANYGLFSILYKIVRISDSLVVLHSKTQGDKSRDTINFSMYFNDPNITLDSLKSIYGKDVKFVGFQRFLKKRRKQLLKEDKNKQFVFLPFLPNSGIPPFAILFVGFVLILSFVFYKIQMKQLQKI